MDTMDSVQNDWFCVLNLCMLSSLPYADLFHYFLSRRDADGLVLAAAPTTAAEAKKVPD